MPAGTGPAGRARVSSVPPGAAGLPSPFFPLEENSPAAWGEGRRFAWSPQWVRLPTALASPTAWRRVASGWSPFLCQRSPGVPWLLRLLCSTLGVPPPDSRPRASSPAHKVVAQKPVFTEVFLKASLNLNILSKYRLFGTLTRLFCVTLGKQFHLPDSTSSRANAGSGKRIFTFFSSQIPYLYFQHCCVTSTAGPPTPTFPETTPASPPFTSKESQRPLPPLPVPAFAPWFGSETSLTRGTLIWSVG